MTVSVALEAILLFGRRLRQLHPPASRVSVALEAILLFGRDEGSRAKGLRLLPSFQSPLRRFFYLDLAILALAFGGAWGFSRP